MSKSIRVDIDLNNFKDEDIREAYEARFGLTSSAWAVIYEKRSQLSQQNFLSYIDKVIQDRTGRIL